MPCRSLITRVALSVGHFMRPSNRATMREFSGEPERTLVALLGPLMDGQLDRERRAVLPEALERVVHAVLLVEDVHHQVAEVEKDPAALRLALAAQRLHTGVVQ